MFTHRRITHRAGDAARILLVILGLSGSPAVAAAQGWDIVQPAPDCKLFRRAFDNPFSDNHGYWQPRAAWHLEYAVGSLLVGYTLHRFTRLPRWASTLVTVGLGVAPHVRSTLVQRRYPINPGDFAFDFWNRAAPAFWMGHVTGDTVRLKPPDWPREVAAWAIGYALTACFASP